MAKRYTPWRYWNDRFYRERAVAKGRKMTYIIQLKNSSYWISPEATTLNIHAAAKFATRWLALAEMARAGQVMHQAAIIEYKPQQV